MVVTTGVEQPSIQTV